MISFPDVDIIRCFSTKELKGKLYNSLEHYKEIFPLSKTSLIVLKPNLNSNMNALTGNTTDLRILSVVIQFLKDKGYTHIVIGEGTNSGFYRNKIGVISRLKVDKLAAYYGVEVKDFNYANPYPVEFTQGVKAQVAKECIEADLFINLPKFKTHFEMGMSVCLKNLIGCLIGQENKKKTHTLLAENIIKLNQAVKPHLHIVDGLIAMEGLGPTRGTPLLLNSIIIGRDPYLIDLLCARIGGFDYKNHKTLVRTLCLAEEKGLLTSEHHRIVESVDITSFKKNFKYPRANPFAGFIHHPKRQKYFLAIRNTTLFSYLAATGWFGKILFFTGLRQDVFSKEDMHCHRLYVETKICKQCGRCQAYCPLDLDLPKYLDNPDNKCLECLYCYMICPNKAIQFEGKLGFVEEQMRQYDIIIRKLHH